MVFRVNSAKCTGCQVCIGVCPQGAIGLKEDRAVINEELCTACGICLEICAANAIYEVKAPTVALEPARVTIRPRLTLESTRWSRTANNRKEVSEMPFGRGWFGRGGIGMGRGIGFGRGMGLGRGNPYPFCRFYPWLPRRWWAYGGGYHPTAQPGVYGRGSYYEPTAPYP